MIFTSDNASGMPDVMLQAIIEANAGYASSYGVDELSRKVEDQFSGLFERDVDVFMVATGTAANSIGLSGLVPPYGGIFCHHESHIMVDECGGPEFMSGGARLIGLPGEGAKLEVATLEAAMQSYSSDNQHSIQPAALSITQATECGQVYSVSEVEALAETAHRGGLAVHMDGARFANAIASLRCDPADITWRAGVDVMSFGGTKNGCLAAEAIVIFDKARADDIRFRRKRAGHLWSKSRFLGAQLSAYLEEDRWMTWASHANAVAQSLSNGLSKINSVEIAWPTDANEVFALMPRVLERHMKEAGVSFYEWPGDPPRPLSEDMMLARMVCSFATTKEDVEKALALAKRSMT